ncbi:type I addiction module toxin, SymE family [Pectobacterium brasiliense]|uniref:SymE family type I addiction module toxin n=1 Tax=Pectobacterium brasiliense TaxID=180957 RepID=UPI000B96E50F|nr:SymE family type I addiction module toxin [Pectobacterium carotovorum]OYN53318.1 hypothetical protein B7L51_00685 [Pectobacterium carotovorum]QHQ20839.1 type I addiction module toxin, SymE family [Pectobacterium brasiliense]
MATLHSTSDLPATKPERTFIVGYRPKCLDTSTPSITLSGKWLREAGFETGNHYTLKVMPGCLVLVTLTDKEETLTKELTQTKLTLAEMKGMLESV